VKLRADTKPVSKEELDELRRGGPYRRAVSLLVHHRAGVQVAVLQPDRRVVVGREPGPGGVGVDDESLSREHASFTLAGTTVRVVDRDSKNGTWFLGDKVKEAELVAGDEVRLGTVSVRVHGDEALGRAARPLRHETFRVMLDDEVQRAQYTKRPLSLVMVRAAGTPVSSLHPLVSATLRPIDRMAFYSSDTLEILLPEWGVKEAAAWAEGLAASFRRQRTAVAVGVTAYPSAARDAEALAGECRDLVTTPGDGGSVRVASGTPERAAAEPPEEIVLGVALRRDFDKIDRLAPSKLPILLIGETGVGKEVLARRIHASSPRRDAHMVVVNCAAIPESLVEAMLFGHEKGAFTGALERRDGLFKVADRGTLMLDEVGELPRAVQAVLLRVLESGMVRRVGAKTEIPVDVRILAATNRDLDAMVAAGTFRADLLHRLEGERYRVPPLRERREDILPLCRVFIDRSNCANGRRVTGIDAAAEKLLLAYPWPGNVRELRNTIERAVVVCASDRIAPEDLPDRVRAAEPSPPTPPSLPPPPPEDPGPGAPGLGLRERVAAYESRLIQEALAATGSTKLAAERLGLPLRTLLHKMSVLGIKRTAAYRDEGRSRPR